ncbi:hypothetical protein FH972_020174 [Carpinus fangiana]|uniref:Uncharacterized protein n=1 Tax=Carpinus fangiana TaxID=176857 RepID=A0A5N6RSL9_9ROSI|nr:hypothetical protein FH972_020174 [Carpinus fangiana]
MMKLCEFNENKERNSYLRRPSSDRKIRAYTQCRAGPIRSAASGKSQQPSTDSLCKICRGNMISVWNFLIARVKSEKTVENIRRNITVHGGGSGGDSGGGGKEKGETKREMGGFPCESESWVSSTTPVHQSLENEALENHHQSTSTGFLNQDEEWAKLNINNTKKKKKKNLESAQAPATDLCSSVSSSIANWRISSPALENHHQSTSTGFLNQDEEWAKLNINNTKKKKKNLESAQAPATDLCSSVSSPIANWRISSPGE